MSFGKALYFPYINFRDENWLKYTLLYWEAVKRIVPPDLYPSDSGPVNDLVAAGVVENVNPKDGARPYTEAAAEEFIPTVEEFLRRRGGHFGTSGQIAQEIGREDAALVHVEKVDARVHSLLVESGLARAQGEWLAVPPELAGLYMLCLAAHISEKQNTPMLSDSFEMEAGGTFFQHSRITRAEQQLGDEYSFRLARMVLPVPRPENLGAVTVERILRFRESHAAERRQLRAKLEALGQEAAGYDDPAAVGDFLQDRKRMIDAALEDQRGAMRELNVGVAHSLVSVSVPSAVAAAAASTFDPVVSALGAGLGVAFSLLNWAVKSRGEKRKAIKGSDYHYLLRVEQEFGPEQAARSGQEWAMQFIYD